MFEFSHLVTLLEFTWWDGVVDNAFVESLKVNLSRLIAYAESADVALQRG
jgi:hypothetical protein